MSVKLGDIIPAKQFFVSKQNVRVNEEFGESEEDRLLAFHLSSESIKQPFVARPKGEGYGVVTGRRRFLAKMKAGAKSFVVGEDVLIRDMTDTEALDSSILENLDYFKKDLNPILRAKSMMMMVEKASLSLRELSRKWRVPLATLSRWLKILELSPSLQEAIEKGLLPASEAEKIAFMHLDETIQNSLAKILVEKGYGAFQKELNALKAKRETRGLPADKYFVFRVTLNKGDAEDLKLYESWTRLATVLKKDPAEMTKDAMRYYMTAKA